MLDWIKFWKKRDDAFNLGTDFSQNQANDANLSTHNPFSSDPYGQDPLKQDGFKADPFKQDSSANPFSQSPQPFSNPAQPNSSNPFAPQAFQDKAMHDNSVSAKDLELLSSKMDTIKAMLENVINRLDRIEKEKDQIRVEPKKWH